MHGPGHLFGFWLLVPVPGTSRGPDLDSVSPVSSVSSVSSSFSSFWAVLPPCPDLWTDLLPVWALRLPPGLAEEVPGRTPSSGITGSGTSSFDLPLSFFFFFFLGGSTGSSSTGISMISSSSAWLRFFPCLGAVGGGSRVLAELPSAAKPGKSYRKAIRQARAGKSVLDWSSGQILRLRPVSAPFPDGLPFSRADVERPPSTH